MSIRVWDYLEEYRREEDEILDGIRKVLNSGRLILGPSVSAFETAFAEYCEAEYGIGVDNGTNAIALALRALGVGPSDEVITVPNTAVPTVVAIESTGARTKFVDVEVDTYCLDSTKLAAAITPRTRAIVPVHLYGQMADMEGIMGVAAAHGLAVVEDCAQSHGARQRGARCGSLGAAGAFSFYPTKVLGGYGDGGMVVTNDIAVEERVRQLRFYGMVGEYYAESLGFNCRLDELHAEVLLRKLPRLDQYVAARREIAERYNQALCSTSLVLPTTKDENEHVYYLYVCRHPRRDHIIEELRKRDILVNISYPYPIHTMRGFDYLGYHQGDFPNAEMCAAEVFSLPMYPSLKVEHQEAVCRALGNILGETVHW